MSIIQNSALIAISQESTMSKNANEIHIKNHFVPEAYLKNWADTEGKIWTYKTLVSHEKIAKWKKFHTNAIAYHKHLYTIKISGNENDELEKWFDKEFESPAIPVIKKVTSDKKLSRDEWKSLINFIASQDIRTISKLIDHIMTMNKILPEIINEEMDKISEKIKSNKFDFNYKSSKPKYFDLFPLKLEKLPTEDPAIGKIKATTYNGRALWFFSIKSALEKVAKVLHNYKWKIIKSSPGTSWPTSDNPVIKVNYLERGKYNLKGGWGVKNGVIFFPLGPQHAAFVEIGVKSSQKMIQCTELETNHFKKLIFENAHRMIFSNEIDSSVNFFRERIVDSELVNSEKNQISEWIQESAKFESEFDQINIPVSS